MKKLSLLAIALLSFALACTKENKTGNKIPVANEELSVDCRNIALATLLANTQCPANYEPVCGCDAKTYSNSCGALRAGIAVFTPGKCPSKSGIVISPVLEGYKNNLIPVALVDFDCATVYQPVCGADGKTYGNLCYALKAGVIVYVPGKCGEGPLNPSVN